MIILKKENNLKEKASSYEYIDSVLRYFKEGTPDKIFGKYIAGELLSVWEERFGDNSEFAEGMEYVLKDY